jgi:monoamine oxidase
MLQDGMISRWAGAECAPQWNGYMEGAVRSGEATADAVAARAS